jgi:DNA-binding CsgD family transcriptional regulator
MMRKNKSGMFTKRELDVIELLMQGQSNKKISIILNIKTRTVEFHLSNIYNKIEVKSRFEAMRRIWLFLGLTDETKL